MKRLFASLIILFAGVSEGRAEPVYQVDVRFGDASFVRVYDGLFDFSLAGTDIIRVNGEQVFSSALSLSPVPALIATISQERLVPGGTFFDLSGEPSTVRMGFFRPL